MTAGGEIEFVAVPWADDVARFAEAQAGALLVGCDHFLDLVKDLALADRAAGMRADVLVGQDLAAGAEEADFESFAREYAIIAVRDVVALGGFALQRFGHCGVRP